MCGVQAAELSSKLLWAGEGRKTWSRPEAGRPLQGRKCVLTLGPGVASAPCVTVSIGQRRFGIQTDPYQIPSSARVVTRATLSLCEPSFVSRKRETHNTGL